MLNVNDLIGIDYIPKEDEVTLNLYIEFYNTYLSNRIFKFELETGSVVKLFFKDLSEIFHVSGIEHVYSGIPMNGARFIKEVIEGKITFEILSKVNHKAYTDYKDRILSYLCIDTIIKNCEYLWFSNGKIEGTKIKVSYLLLKGVEGKNLHLGIDTYKPGRPYFTRTLLVTERNSGTKFIDKADDRIRVAKIEVVEKSSDRVMEVIDRKGAYEQCRVVVNGIIDKWCEEHIEDMLLEYCKDKFSVMSNQEWLRSAKEIIEQNKKAIYDFVIKEINENDEIKECIFERDRLDGKDKADWDEILQQLYIEHVQYDCYWSKALRATLMDAADTIINHIVSLKGQFVKRKIVRSVSGEINTKKTGIIQSVCDYDKYWAGRIYREVTTDDLKNCDRLCEHCSRYMDLRMTDLIEYYIDGIIGKITEETVEKFRNGVVEFL